MLSRRSVFPSRMRYCIEGPALRRILFYFCLDLCVCVCVCVCVCGVGFMHVHAVLIMVDCS